MIKAKYLKQKNMVKWFPNITTKTLIRKKHHENFSIHEPQRSNRSHGDSNMLQASQARLVFFFGSRGSEETLPIVGVLTGAMGCHKWGYPPRSLTAHPWNMLVGRLPSEIGKVYFQGRTVKFRKGIWRVLGMNVRCGFIRIILQSMGGIEGLDMMKTDDTVDGNQKSQGQPPFGWCWNPEKTGRFQLPTSTGWFSGRISNVEPSTVLHEANQYLHFQPKLHLAFFFPKIWWPKSGWFQKN